MTAIPDSLAETIWNAWLPGEVWASLHSADPGKTGANETGVVGRAPVHVDERQTVTISGSPTGGTFTLTYAGQTTAGIAYNANAAAVQAALEALSNVGVGDVSVAGGPGPGTPWVVRFTGALAKTDVALMTADGSGLTGGTSPSVGVAETVKGVALAAFAADATSGGRKRDNAGVAAFGTASGSATLTHLGTWDAQTAGNWQGGAALTGGSISVTAGQPIEIPAGDLDLYAAGDA